MKKLMIMLTVLIFAVSMPLIGQTVQVGDEAPNFTAITIMDKEFSVHETAKDSIIVLYFMGYS